MPPIVKLEDIVEALDFPEEWEVLLDPDTGKVITITEDDQVYLEEDDPGHLPAWQQNSVVAARDALDNDRLLRFPDRYDIHEWNIMREFAEQQEPRAADKLLNAIRGAGAFRRFKTTLDRLGLLAAWFDFRANAFSQIAKEWLDSNGIAWVEAGAGGSAKETGDSHPGIRASATSTQPSHEPVEQLYREVVDGWNTLDATRMAAAFTPTGIVVGYDGSEMSGAAAIEAGMANVFRDHRPGRWVMIVREIQYATPDVALLRAHAGWFMSSEPQSFPQAVQMVVAVREDDEWRIARLQTTPAALHGRPEAAAALADELRQAARSI